MMKLFTVCMTVFFMSVVFSCSDDTVVETQGDVHLDASAVELDSSDILAVDTLGEADSDSGPDDAADTAEAVGDAGSDDVSGGDITNIEIDAEQLPEDPTENPDESSSFYEFPAWEIPPSENDKDGNR